MGDDVIGITYAVAALVFLWTATSASVALAQITPAPDAIYSVRSVETGRVVDVRGISHADGAQVQQSAWNGGDNQKWRFFRLPPPDNGYYRIVAVHSGKVLDVTGANLADGAFVIQQAWHGGDNQKWRVIGNGDGSVTLQAKHSNKVLDVPGLSHDEGLALQQYASNGGPNQRWRLRREGGGAVTNTGAGFRVPGSIARRAQEQSSAMRVPPRLVSGGVRLTPTAPLDQTELAPGQFLEYRVPPASTNIGNLVERSLGVEYAGPNSSGQFLQLRPVIRREQRGMRLGSDGRTYLARIYVRLRDQFSPNDRKATPQGTAIQILADPATVEPERLAFPQTNSEFQVVQVSSDAPESLVVVTLIPSFSDSGVSDTIPVIRPRVVFLNELRALPGWGAGAAILQVGLSADAGSGEWQVSLGGDGVAVSPSTVTLRLGVPERVELRSVGIGRGIVTAQHPGLVGAELPVPLTFPIGFFIASLVGGSLGSTLRRLLTKSGSRRMLRRHFIAGILMGVVVAGAFILGVNLTQLPIPAQENPFAVALIAATGSIALMPLFERLEGLKGVLQEPLNESAT